MKNLQTRLIIENVNAQVTPLPGRAFIGVITNCVREARASIDIIQFEWKWYHHEHNSPIQQLSYEVLQAGRRGIRIRVLLNKENPRHPLTPINKNTIRNLENVGISAKFGPSSPITHAKLWIIDNELTILGSHNLSKRAVSVNDEASVKIISKEVAGEFSRYFDTLWNRQ